MHHTLLGASGTVGVILMGLREPVRRACISACPPLPPCLRRPPQYVGSMHGDETSNGVLLLLLARELCVGPKDSRVQVGAGCLHGPQMQVS